MKSNQIGTDTITLPDSALPGEAAIIIGQDLPPCMTTPYAAAQLFRPPNSQTGVLDNDAPYYFIGQRVSTGANIEIVDFGIVMYDPTIPYCNFTVFSQHQLSKNIGLASVGAETFYGQIANSGTLGLSNDSHYFTGSEIRWRGGTVVNIENASSIMVGTVGAGQQTGYIPYTPRDAEANAIFAVPVASAAIPGTLINFTVLRATDVFKIVGVFDFERIAAGGGTAVGQLLVDGVIQTRVAPYSAGTIGNRASVSQQWTVSGLAAGAHTFQLAGLTTGAALVWRALNPHTCITVDPRF